MKILLTGGAGYIGSMCAKQLLAAGHEIAVFDNLSTGHREAVPAGVDLYLGDLLEAVKIEEAMSRFAPDAVMHFAALALVGESMKDPGKYFETNVSGGLNLLRAMVKSGVKRMVFSSTCAVYGTPSELPITEETPLQPINPYGESKLMFERMLQWYGHIHGLKSTVFRYFNAGGAWDELGEDHDPETHLIPNILKVPLGKASSVSVFGDDYETPDGTCQRDYVHVRDVARAHLLALESGREGVFNLGTGTPASVKEVVAACEQASGWTIPTVSQVRREGDPPILYANADKARTELGWESHFTGIDPIVETAWQWFKSHPHGYGAVD